MAQRKRIKITTDSPYRWFRGSLCERDRILLVKTLGLILRERSAKAMTRKRGGCAATLKSYMLILQLDSMTRKLVNALTNQYIK